jgi:outer membrane protein assembly factor BamB
MRPPLRLLLVLAVAAVAGGASPAPYAASSCYDAAIVSLRSGATLHRYHARDGGVIRAYAASTPLLPGEDAVADGQGGWYVAGAGLAHLRGDGRLDTRWHSQLRRHLRLWTFARAGARLFASDGRRVYAVAARSGKLLWTSAAIGGGSAARIWALVATPSTVYVGGAFKRFGAVSRGQLAALSAATGRVLAWRTPPLRPYTPSPIVGTLALGAERLYFAGSFHGVGGAPRSNAVAAVRLRDGRLTSFAPRGSFSGALALAVVRGKVLIGGGDGGGVFDAKTGRLWIRSFIVETGVAIAVRGWTAYVGGNLRNNIGLHNLLAVGVRSGDLRRWFPNVARQVAVAKIALSGDKAFVGGLFCARL